MSDVNDGMVNSPARAMSFKGTGGEFFVIWLVNAILTTITLGLFLPWAFVRSRRYFYENTELAGKKFAYHATGKSILVGWLCIAVLYGIFLVNIAHNNAVLSLIMMLLFILFSPWLIMQGLRYQAMMTTLNGVRFNFRTNPLRAWWVMLGQPLLIVVVMSMLIASILSVMGSAMSAGMVIGGSVCIALISLFSIVLIQGLYISQWGKLLINNLQYGNAKFDVSLETKKCGIIVAKAIVLFIPFMIAAGYFIVAPILHLAKYSGSPEDIVLMAAMQSAGSILLGYILYMLGILVCYCYGYVAIRNYIYSQASLHNGAIRFRSTARIGAFVWLVVSNLFVCSITAFLAYPWARVRATRYLLENTHVEGDLDQLPVEDHNDKPAADPANLLARGLSVMQFVF
ncbi:hypothetical protein DT73_22090 [Mangrovibacter sp. MFB070]|uniref:YjgN family protein n=1 Tax=Mangrovibacter sp. MFB070 TaxID=1224318 RepID=UPI0004D6D3F8|nr:DUF898 family protein [Mangrovibacter sp. MFB070]KEA50660.1 hypothetical protein DT73_22090 [Mangrovibacter sp. MFB070]